MPKMKITKEKNKGGDPKSNASSGGGFDFLNIFGGHKGKKNARERGNSIMIIPMNET